jgi:tetratricopeptide (TPR) repeat protein
MQDSERRAIARPGLWITLLSGEVLWCLIASRTAGNWYLAGAASLFAANCFGNVCGIFSAFLFTSSGKEEESTFGKIRDWMLAGITGAGATEIMERGGSVKRLLELFAIGPQSGEFALVISTVAIGFTSGFFFMFFQRELNLNVLLAKARALTAASENAQSASTAVQELLSKLPPFLLTDISDVSESELSPSDRSELEQLLLSDNVNKFLDQMKERTESGAAVDWDSVSKTAFIQYYRTYFVKKEDRKRQIDEAERWVKRALIMEPLHGALTVAYADLHSLQEDYPTAAQELKDLIANGDPPASAFQQLGYYLLEDGKDTESVRYSKKYLELYPDDASTCFNLAFCYGRLFCSSPDKPELRTECLTFLSKGLLLDPEHATKIRDTWFTEGFTCLKGDAQVVDALNQADARAKPSKSTDPGTEQQS